MTGTGALTLLLASVISSTPSLASGKEGDLRLEGLTIAVGSSRTWTEFDGLAPQSTNAEHWEAGEAKLQSVPDPSGARLRSGTREVKQGSGGYVATIQSFAAGDAPVASGTFLEVLLRIRNHGKAAVRVDLLDPASGAIDAQLLLADGTLSRPRAFMIPGLDVASTSLVASFKGALRVALAPGGETWALLLFDVPADAGSPRLLVKKAPPMGLPVALAAAPKPADLERWRGNCAAVASYGSELTFTVQLTEPKMLGTSRAALLQLLDRLRVDDAGAVKASKAKVVAAVKAAPAFKAAFGSADVAISKALDVQLHELLAAVSVEAEKRGVVCKDASKAGGSLLAESSGGGAAPMTPPRPTPARAAPPPAASAPPGPGTTRSEGSLPPADVRKRLQGVYVEFLKGEGFRPEINKDGDVKFTREGYYYVFQIDVDEPTFVRLLFPNVWEARSDAERAKLLGAVEEATHGTKVAKAFLVEGQAWIAYEQFLQSEAELSWWFARAMRVLGSARRTLAEKMERK